MLQHSSPGSTALILKIKWLNLILFKFIRRVCIGQILRWIWIIRPEIFFRLKKDWENRHLPSLTSLKPSNWSSRGRNLFEKLYLNSLLVKNLNFPVQCEHFYFPCRYGFSYLFLVRFMYNLYIFIYPLSSLIVAFIKQTQSYTRPRFKKKTTTNVYPRIYPTSGISCKRVQLLSTPNLNLLRSVQWHVIDYY